MASFQDILEKLDLFVRRFYLRMLIKGAILFVVLGLLFLFVILGIEYFLWLNSTGRLLLLIALAASAMYLLFRYILTPLFYLFKIRKGISNKEASLLIGKHFPEVGDKLFNLLELADDPKKSELLLASMEQRSENLAPVPFKNAIRFRDSYVYAKYLILPLLVLGLVWFSGNLGSFFGSYNRVVNYDMAYEPPAPFVFKLLSPDLDILENESFTAQVVTEGEVLPKDIYIVIDGTEFLLQKQNGLFQYTFSAPLKSGKFYFVSNGIRSREYFLNVMKTPSILNFEMVLEYPAYTGKSREIVKSTGNAFFPEGTRVSWAIEGDDIDRIDLVLQDTALALSKEGNRFNLSKRIYADLEYQITTSNANVRDFEKLEYRFRVIKDAYPTVKVQQALDSLNPNTAYYSGEATDDYQLSNIRLAYYADSDPENVRYLDLLSPNSGFSQFYYTFPSGLDLEEGKSYGYYFEVRDNDAVHGGKATKSQVFTTNLLNRDQLFSKELHARQSLIQHMDRSLDRLKEQKETYKEIDARQKEKSTLNFNDKTQVRDFLKNRQEQEEQMKKFSQQLKENLEKSVNYDEKDYELNQLLRERLERQEMEARKNEKLLEELNRIAEKLDKEELSMRLEELAKKQANNERNLEQLLELTKRYYVTEKATQMARELEKLGKRQEILSDLNIDDEFSDDQQGKLNHKFEELADELKELKKDDEHLKKPLGLKIDLPKTESVKKDQNEALEEINKHKGNDSSSEIKDAEKTTDKVKQKQKAAAQKIREMGEALGSAASASSGDESMAEDAEMLRQILDNLVIFSFKQEGLFEHLRNADVEVSQFSGTVRDQQELREMFEHVDDSLFSLSLRRAELSEFVNTQINEVYYNIDKSLESIAEGQLFQGISHQNYVLNAANELAAFLANILDNMQQNMQLGKGQGQGDGFQLPDIIKGQEELKEKMEGMGKEGQGQPSGSGDKGKGESGKDGEEGTKPGEGRQGQYGEQGGKNAQGKGGKQGESPNGQSDGQEGSGASEEELREIYEIYKGQQMLRDQLEMQLRDMINADDRKLGEKLLRQMEDFEDDLIENGITQRSLSKISNIRHELLKLENAALKKGEKQERESTSNREQFQAPILSIPPTFDNYRNEVEILNRQALPLRPNFQDRVKEYFKEND